MSKSELDTKQAEFINLKIRDRKEELTVDREARTQLASETWSAPARSEWGKLSYEPPDYLIHGAIENGTVGTLVGQWGTGKSFMALDLAACVALGIPWHGHTIKQASNALYVAAEGGLGMGRRRRAWELHHHLEMPSDAFTFLLGPIPLGAQEGIAFLKEEIRRADAGLVIIDTLARCSSGLNENDAIDMGKVIETLYELRDCREEPSTIMVVHHHGKDTSRGARGSSRLTADVDFSYDIEKDQGTLVMRCSKVKDGEAMNNFAFTLMQVELGDKHGTTSCVIQHNGGLTGQMAEQVRPKESLGFCGREDCVKKVKEGRKYCPDCECKGVRDSGEKCPHLGKFKGGHCGWHTENRKQRWEAA